jgi:pimeloyl-ACP methyl ester carboxylesterase
LGALVAAGVAAELPQLVRAAVLEDPPSSPFLANPDATGYGAIFRGFQEASRRKSATVAEMAAVLAALSVPTATGAVTLGTLRDATSLRLSARMLTELDPEAITPLVAGRWLEGIDFQAVLRRVRCPVLLLQADEAAGGMLSDAEAAKMLACLGDGSPARFPGIGHQIHWLAPEALLRHLLAFLEALPWP